jgi:transcription antitermination factor NusA-like protein
VLKISEDLGGEMVSVAGWSDDPKEFVASALFPGLVRADQVSRPIKTQSTWAV